MPVMNFARAVGRSLSSAGFCRRLFSTSGLASSRGYELIHDRERRYGSVRAHGRDVICRAYVDYSGRAGSFASGASPPTSLLCKSMDAQFAQVAVVRQAGALPRCPCWRHRRERPEQYPPGACGWSWAGSPGPESDSGGSGRFRRGTRPLPEGALDISPSIQQTEHGGCPARSRVSS